MSNFRAEIHVHISSSDDATEEEVVELNRARKTFHGVFQLSHPAKQTTTRRDHDVTKCDAIAAGACILVIAEAERVVDLFVLGEDFDSCEEVV